jgi:hypothetical protein
VSELRSEDGFPTDASVRKGQPVVSGVLDYFPQALLAVAELSRVGNEQHNNGELMHWARGKSMDHADTIVRHLMQRGTWDETTWWDKLLGKVRTASVRHSTKVAWRALALLQEEIEVAEGLPMSRGSRQAPVKEVTGWTK